MCSNNILLRVALLLLIMRGALCNVEMLAGMRGYLKDLCLDLLQKENAVRFIGYFGNGMISLEVRRKCDS